jgi:hypothetical protein
VQSVSGAGAKRSEAKAQVGLVWSKGERRKVVI